MEGWLGCAAAKGLLAVTGHDIQTKQEIDTRVRGCRENESELVNLHLGFKSPIQYLDDDRVKELEVRRGPMTKQFQSRQRRFCGRLSTEEMRQ